MLTASAALERSGFVVLSKFVSIGFDPMEINLMFSRAFPFFTFDVVQHASLLQAICSLPPMWMLWSSLRV
jgi:hypothetical protein